ncbi:hypothetical protein F3Y22_tig00110327pilonHSYRG00042 [Hibiscus syriacus]|uniref:Uncharacterized protein n=1 Tax=Hibiscus syriacus TaxID=106335 RepID=A0A6A3AZJ6_HIBSY|nr:hypothetical protein F3Y22_tig00110327pilonHSYRG00042 [Hibiscus syriacus]
MELRRQCRTITTTDLNLPDSDELDGTMSSPIGPQINRVTKVIVFRCKFLQHFLECPFTHFPSGYPRTTYVAWCSSAEDTWIHLWCNTRIANHHNPIDNIAEGFRYTSKPESECQKFHVISIDFNVHTLLCWLQTLNGRIGVILWLPRLFGLGVLGAA